MRRSAMVASMVFLVAFGGCGGGGSGDDKTAAGDVVKTYLGAIGAGDGDEACGQLTGNAKRKAVDYGAQLLPEIGAVTCEEFIDALSANIGGDETARLKDVEIDQVTVSGDRATVRIVGATSDARLIKADDRWYIDDGIFGG